VPGHLSSLGSPAACVCEMSEMRAIATPGVLAPCGAGQVSGFSRTSIDAVLPSAYGRRRAGIHARHRDFPEMFHGFMTIMPFEAAASARDLLWADIRGLLRAPD
jgi:hypothetical protein